MDSSINLNVQHLKMIEELISNNRISHAYLFEVDDYEYAMEFIKRMVKLLLCSNSNSLKNLNCDKCNVCRLIDNNSYPDLLTIEPDGNWIKKQQLKELQDEMNNKSLLGKKRIYIIKEAEKLNASSSNSLLKFLEEPADDIIAIFLTENRYLMLNTILSRCQIYNLKKQTYNIDEFSNENAEEFIEYLARKKNLFVVYKNLLDYIFVDKKKVKEVLTSVEKYFLFYLVNNEKKELFDESVYKMLKKIDLENMVNYVQIIETELQKLEYNVNFKIWIDNFISRIIGEVYD